MCGIAGIFSYHNPPADRTKILRSMSRVMSHRGPDSEGFYENGRLGMGMRRLKVIDLEFGDQPVHNEDRSLWIIFNGEIYNYRELREKLVGKGHQFYTHSDTEVIVHLYQEEKEKCVEYLIGMFAFAVYDVREESLFIARDRLGIKPLFYHSSPEAFVFGSEIKNLLQVPWIPQEPDPQAISHFLSLNYLPAPWTGFRCIFQLPPGHWMKITQQGFTRQSYWDIPREETLDVSEEEACRTILRLLRQSMQRRLIADVPIGAFLSGGLDSTALLYLMKEQKQERIKTFSVGFDEPQYDESPFARAASRFFGTEHHELKCAPNDVANFLEDIVWKADNLLADQAALPLYCVSKLAKGHVTVCLSGDGGDEVFVGYPTFHADRYHHFYSKIPSVLRHEMIEKLIHLIPSPGDKVGWEYQIKKFVQAGDFSPEKAHYWWRTIYTEEEKRRLLQPSVLDKISEVDASRLYQEHFGKEGTADFVRRCLYADFKVWLSGNNLYKVDAMSMAHGLEVRVPFLDHELVEYVSRLPVSLRFHGHQLKYLLKKIMGGKLPQFVLSRRKAGFHTPIALWFRSSLLRFAVSKLLRKDAAIRHYVHLDFVRKLLDEHRRARHNHAFKIWGLLIFSQWLDRHFISGTTPNPMDANRRTQDQNAADLRSR